MDPSTSLIYLALFLAAVVCSVGLTALLARWYMMGLLRRVQDAPDPPPTLDPASVAWLQAQFDKQQTQLQAQQAADRAEMRQELRQYQGYAVAVTDSFQRLTVLYNAMRRHLIALEAHLQTWPEVTKGLPTYSAADPPPLPTPPWLHEGD